ncbi:acetyltransferase [Pseudomonas sp. 21LCFQ02]|uniref:GNAT family N-acetyltransferase n=1 Tax=Pseudomonas sp. 21LCFQ02 TaxID=2957505 RepID=UPI00209AA5C0|nr:GNAT family N-acetyltransferase [Pseudomonas sp. 21LCFQ02]MCO8171476.1 acetyltransferase [Pseudomonas sp. 21LCFQ02]
MNTHADLPVLSHLYPDRQLRVHYREDTLVVLLDNIAHLEIALYLACSDQLEGKLRYLEHGLEQQTLLAALEAVFTTHPSLKSITLTGTTSTATDSLIADGVLRITGPERITCYAEAFWQHPQIWLNKASFGAAPQQLVISDGKRHPLRPRSSTEVLYSRYIPWLGQTLTFQQADPDRDLHAFNRWMNSPRVAHFWEEEGSLEQHHAYLQKQLNDPHTLPLIGRFDGQPFGYFEAYWAKEDRIAPFYDAADYDRGLHLLVGEEAFRGKAFYTAWFSSICHYLFLDDPRTQRLVCEPRHDNLRQIANFDRSGFAKVKHFDFPHKRALLVMLTRERFFSERLYQPLDSVKPSKEGITV